MIIFDFGGGGICRFCFGLLVFVGCGGGVNVVIMFIGIDLSWFLFGYWVCILLILFCLWWCCDLIEGVDVVVVFVFGFVDRMVGVGCVCFDDFFFIDRLIFGRILDDLFSKIYVFVIVNDDG